MEVAKLQLLKIFRPLALLTLKKVKDDLSFRIGTISLFAQPILWLSIFLFLRNSNLAIETNAGLVSYSAFLVVGILVWRMVTHVMSSISNAVREEGPALRGILAAPLGESSLFWSGFLSSMFVAALIGIAVLLTGIIFYNFSFVLDSINNALLALFVLSLVMIIHAGIATLMLASSFQIKDVKSVGFVVTTTFGLLSGVFFPAEYFPEPLNHLAYALPLTQGITLIRELTLFSDAPPLNWNLLFLLIAESIAFLVAGRILYRKKIRLYLN